MNSVNTQGNVPIKIWANEVEAGALLQARNLANLPFIFKHVALMPDVHQGYGMPIGGVIATKNVVIPNAVGKDIGCGMLAVRTSLRDIDPERLEQIRAKIKHNVPVGFQHQRKGKFSVDDLPQIFPFQKQYMPVISEQLESLPEQLGTLGGGNHFIEIQKGDDGFVYFMIHSGSRNIGSRVADHYDKLARNLNAKWHSSVPKEHELAFLPMGTDEAIKYMTEMKYCVDFGLANRMTISMGVVNAINDIFPGTEFGFPTNIAHNYAAIENHFGHNVVVHRKGATKAMTNEVGIIPGSMGTKSYIVKGLGNQESFFSCSHGAGRVLGRKAAQRELNLEDEQKILNDQGILHDMNKKANLEEAAGAYKNIDVVMNNQMDLVKILVELTPMAVIKG